ncbi:Bax protein [Halospina denitrificans]|uniref:Bax protein n=1 Tax=Halospina denitrificans TaxID=332522 RepID=A0A4R7K052_9GAMM|nr:glucosaminidase domain-containing protein [Halospina denitrificans]TDT43223.1 Bax protein [Halospina denitrificans]
MESRTTAVFALIAAILIAALAAGALVASLDLEKTVDVPKMVEKPELPGWRSAPLPDFTRYSAGTERKEAFFGFLFPRIALANLEILRQREGVKALRRMDALSEKQKEWLKSHALRLRVRMDDDAFFEKLLNRLDIVPPSLVMAQAANESAWGTSRFATRGNNLFGQWCFTPGCGIVPGQRTQGRSHEVAAYKHPYASIRSYLTNLNRHNAYTPLRELRARKRQRNEFTDGTYLAGGLERYSERGNEYVREIRAMISFNELEAYDARLKQLMDADAPLAELEKTVSDYRQRYAN